MYYHNLNVIRKGSKNLLTIKNSKSVFLTPSILTLLSIEYLSMGKWNKGENFFQSINHPT